MAIYHFSGKVIGRKSAPSASCVAAAAYRSAEHIGDNDYTRKSGVVWSDMLYCDGCPDELKSREALWTAVDQVEKRKDAQLYRSFDFAFPNEFTYEDCQDVITDFAQEQWVDLGMCADLCIHDTQHDGVRNLHGHAMLTLRDIDENGLGKKNRTWNEHELMEQWREAWAEKVNERLKVIGEQSRVEHKSFERLGESDLTPTVHEGKAVTALERKGVRTAVGDYNREVRERNNIIKRSVEWLMKKAGLKRMDVKGQARERTRERTR